MKSRSTAIIVGILILVGVTFALNQSPEIVPEDTIIIDNTGGIVNSNLKENSETYIDKINLNEPNLVNSTDDYFLYKDYGLLNWGDPLTTENIFFVDDPSGTESYCKKGVLVEDGCKYFVSSEQECIPDPEAPYNGVTFIPNEMSCITHYIHTRYNIKCVRTGLTYDYNDLSQRSYLEECPNCAWFNDHFDSDLLGMLSPSDSLRENYIGYEDYKGVRLFKISPIKEEPVFSQETNILFCTNKVIKFGSISNVTNYIDNFYK